MGSCSSEMEKAKQIQGRGIKYMKEGECAEQLALIFLFPTLLSLLQLQLPLPPLFLPTDPPMAWFLVKC